MAGFPIPRATTAACEVIPPRAVRIPCERSIPGKSSAEVSLRTRMTASPAWPRAFASSGSKTTAPTAAPGLAGKPVAIVLTFAVSSTRGWRSCSSWAGCTRSTAVLSIDQSLRLHINRHPDGCWCRSFAGSGLQHPEFSILDRKLDILHIGVMSLELFANRLQFNECIGESRRHRSCFRRGSACGYRKPHPLPGR